MQEMLVQLTQICDTVKSGTRITSLKSKVFSISSDPTGCQETIETSGWMIVLVDVQVLLMFVSTPACTFKEWRWRCELGCQSVGVCDFSNEGISLHHKWRIPPHGTLVILNRLWKYVVLLLRQTWVKWVLVPMGCLLTWKVAICKHCLSSCKDCRVLK